jgi:antitoxin component HigA of HigAB toxin-antitoxin module
MYTRLYILKKIDNDADYYQTLDFIEEYFDAPIDTPEGDKIEDLIKMAEDYEKIILAY